MWFKSIEGEWFPEDEFTKEELKKQGLTHLGIHVSQDPYIKNLEFVTGVSRKDLMNQQGQAVLQSMQERMLVTQQAIALALAGDKEGCQTLLKSISNESSKNPVDMPIDDKNKIASEEFNRSMRPEGKPVNKYTGKLKKFVDDKIPVHEEVGDSSGGFGVPNGLQSIKELRKSGVIQ